MTRDTQPVSPRPVLPRLIHQALAHIEHHGTDHDPNLRQHRDQPDATTAGHGEIRTDLNAARSERQRTAMPRSGCYSFLHGFKGAPPARRGRDHLRANPDYLRL